jgi:hypothetical protein
MDDDEDDSSVVELPGGPPLPLPLPLPLTLRIEVEYEPSPPDDVASIAAIRCAVYTNWACCAFDVLVVVSSADKRDSSGTPPAPVKTGRGRPPSRGKQNSAFEFFVTL